jgi:hypothetical protein
MVRSLTLALCLIAPAAWAQHHGPENSPLSCSDGIDNDGNGFADCADPKCAGIGACGEVPRLMEAPALPPATQLVASSVMIAAGLAVAGSSSLVFLDATNQAHGSKSAMEYAVGAAMGVGGIAVAAAGAVVLKRAVVAWRKQRELDFLLSAGSMSLRLLF